MAGYPDIFVVPSGLENSALKPGEEMCQRVNDQHDNDAKFVPLQS